ncbi:MAG: hypothetical protein BGO48_13760 [Mucilaginibacter sp. 44-25]|nr:MAG: hypothetical protein BGO48_13760 [Mucilaginibacter sp. 44-25]
MTEIMRSYCSEKFSITHYGAYDIHPRHLVFWICVETDQLKQFLTCNSALNSDLSLALIEYDYPAEGIDSVYIGFESQETVDRESGGNWWHHWK